MILKITLKWCLIVAVFVGLHGLMYLFGSFIELNFDFTTWTKDARAISLLLGSIIGIIGSILTFCGLFDKF